VLLFDPNPPWKKVLFTKPWALSFLVTLLLAVLLCVTFGRAVLEHLRLRPRSNVTPEQWGALDRSRYWRLFRRGAALALLAPVTLLTFQWLMKQLVLGTPGESPVKEWLVDAASWLADRNLVFVALTLAALGALLGVGYDRTLSPALAPVRRVLRRPFV